MSVSAYGSGLSNLGNYVLLCPQGDLTPDKLTDYIKRANTLLVDLIRTHDRDTAVQRLDIIRQEIAVLTNTPFHVLEKSISITTAS
jgi:hypothetical protein